MWNGFYSTLDMAWIIATPSGCIYRVCRTHEDALHAICQAVTPDRWMSIQIKRRAMNRERVVRRLRARREGT
jgi:hypothetical protein